MLDATRTELELVGIEERPDILLADAGYWRNEQIEPSSASGVRLLCPPEAATRQGTRPGWNDGRYSWMRYVLTPSKASSSKEKKSDDRAVFAQMKCNWKFDRFGRRGIAAPIAAYEMAIQKFSDDTEPAIRELVDNATATKASPSS